MRDRLLGPDGYVAFSEQASDPALRDVYVDVYGITVLDTGLPDREQSADKIVVLNSFIGFPAAEDKAFSVGRIVDGTPAEILQWVEDEQIVVRWAKVISGIQLSGEFPVRYTTFVPEPSAVALAALAVGAIGVLACSLRQCRRVAKRLFLACTAEPAGTRAGPAAGALEHGRTWSCILLLP